MNFLFLSIDALRADRTGLHEYGRPTTPNLDRLAAAGVYSPHHTATAAFTQPSLPSMLTSSMPLSYGGYDKGVFNRPPTVFETLGNAGYETSLLSTFPWVNRFFGYEAGISTEHLLFVINALVGAVSQTIASTLKAYEQKIVSREEMLQSVEPVIQKLFDDLTSYCEVRLDQRDIDRTDLANERLVRDGYDYAKIKRIIADHRRRLTDDPAAYVHNCVGFAPNAHNWISRDWRAARSPGALVRYLSARLTATILMPVAPSWSRLLEYRSKRYVDAHALADRLIRVIDARDAGKPFFIWTHFFDTHVPYCPGRGPDWRRNSARHLRALGYDEGTDLGIAAKKRPESAGDWEAWSALYDAAVHYVDQEIGRIVDALESRKLLDDTVIVITSDHGEELGEHGDVSHHFRMYDHNIKVPLVIRGPGVAPGTLGGLTTIMDIAPTVADLAGVDAAPGWEGTSVFSDTVKQRTHTIAEAFHGGNCLFDHRPPYIAVRTPERKYLWKEYRDGNDRFSAEDNELYDLTADPLEQNNIYDPDSSDVVRFNEIVAARLAGIPEISVERIERSLGQAGAAAVRRIRGERLRAGG